MKFTFRAMDADTQDQHKPIHHSQSSTTFSFFRDHSIPGHVKYQRQFEMSEAILREREKKLIREEMIAAERRRRVLEAEVRNELMMERAMAMRSRGGFSLPIMSLPLPPSHEKVQIGHEEKLEGMYGRIRQLSEIRGFSGSSLELLDDSPKIEGIRTPLLEDNKNKGKPNDETVSRRKRKSTPPISEGFHRSQKKAKEEWRCAVCQVSVTCERGLNEHLRGKKHHAKQAAVEAQETGAYIGLGQPKKCIIKPLQLALTSVNPTSSEENKFEIRKKVNQAPETSKPSSTSDPNYTSKKDKDKFEFWCEMCKVGAFSETVMNAHREGKKHSNRLVESYRKGKVDCEPSTTSTCDDKHEPKTDQEVIVVESVVAEAEPVKEDMEDGAGEVEPVKEDMEYGVSEVKPDKDDVEYVIAEVKPDKDDVEYVAAGIKLFKDDMECIAAVVAEENNSINMTAGFGFC